VAADRGHHLQRRHDRDAGRRHRQFPADHERQRSHHCTQLQPAVHPGRVIGYFLWSAQGTLEALRSLNLVWHFTNYTVAHSHLTMYGFVVFLIWGGIYGLLPRMTGREPSHLLAGVHFWFACWAISSTPSR